MDKVQALLGGLAAKDEADAAAIALLRKEDI